MRPIAALLRSKNGSPQTPRGYPRDVERDESLSRRHGDTENGIEIDSSMSLECHGAALFGPDRSSVIAKSPRLPMSPCLRGELRMPALIVFSLLFSPSLCVCASLR